LKTWRASTCWSDAAKATGSTVEEIPRCVDARAVTATPFRRTTSAVATLLSWLTAAITTGDSDLYADAIRAGLALVAVAALALIADLARAAPSLARPSLLVTGLTGGTLNIEAITWSTGHVWAGRTCPAAVEYPVGGLAENSRLAAVGGPVQALKRGCVAITTGTARAAISARQLTLWALTAAWVFTLAGIGVEDQRRFAGHSGNARATLAGLAPSTWRIAGATAIPHALCKTCTLAA
jgi:hypothetical protein